jgi:hypothetical protein
MAFLSSVAFFAKHSFPQTQLLQSPQGAKLLNYIRYFLVEFERLFLV